MNNDQPETPRMSRPEGADQNNREYLVPPPQSTHVRPVQTPQQPATNPGLPFAAKPEPEELLIDWVAPSRPFKQRNRGFFATEIVIVILICLILFFAGQVLPIAVVIAVAFLWYVLSVVAPGNVNHALTTYGLRIENNLYYWEELSRFWYSDKYGQRLLHIETSRFPGRLTLLLGDISEADMTLILSVGLIQQQPELTFYEKASAWLQKKIPLDLD